jgi:hypothetical protein
VAGFIDRLMHGLLSHRSRHLGSAFTRSRSACACAAHLARTSRQRLPLALIAVSALRVKHAIGDDRDVATARSRYL